MSEQQEPEKAPEERGSALPAPVDVRREPWGPLVRRRGAWEGWR